MIFSESDLALLKTWVSAKLEPITDAEVDTLADYVIALVQHDLPIDRLKALCEEQLADFLQDQTGPFVAVLMEALETKSYTHPVQAEAYDPGFRANDNGFMPPPLPYNMGLPPMPIDGTGTWRNGIFIPGMPEPINQGMIPFQEGTHRGGRGGRGRGRGGFTSDRTRYAKKGPTIDPNNKTLIIEKIPQEYCSEEVLKEYFSKFGEVLNVKTFRGSNAELEFSSHDVAESAYKSPEPIFNNRFIKIYWKSSDVDKAAAEGKPITPEINIEEVQKLQQERQAQFEEKLAKRKEHEEKMKQLLEYKTKILKEQEEVLKHAVSTGGDQARIALLEQQVNSLKAEAEQLGVDYTNNLAPRGGGAVRPYRGRGRGGVRGGGFHPYASRGRGGKTFVPDKRSTLDLRPKSVLIKPIPQTGEEPLREYLLSYDNDGVSRSESDPSAVVIDFKTRQTAEKFFAASKSIPGIEGELQHEWIRKTAASSDSMELS